MNSDESWKPMFDRAIARHAASERAWLSSDHRGRWVVMEPGAGHYLKDCSKLVRQYADAATPRRGRRFSSLSRARAFARLIGSNVRRWRNTPPSGGIWRRVSPWGWATANVAAMVTGISVLAGRGRDE